MLAEISPQIELVQVLLYLAEQQDRTCQYLNNIAYVDSIKNRFWKFKNHKAVILTRQFVIERSFYHIKPLRAILQLEDILIDARNEYYEWGEAVKAFVEDADFDSFFKSQSSFYAEILNRVNNCALDTWVGFIEKYFRQKPDDFKLIVCPIAGNYGFTLEKNNKKTAYTVRCMPYCDDNGAYDWDFTSFAKSIAHEYAHCFVNYTVEGNKNRLALHNQFFEKHRKIPHFYNTEYAIINEYFVRAFQIRFMEINKKWFPDFCVSEEYRMQKEMFVYLDRFVNALRLFEESAQSFSDFYIEQIDKILV
ncbi:MAG: DUF4932 domain-containing protein [Clostridia bacterium]|nr:DUF4932 domain-containing protein [Clostridia bacterium]